MPPPGLSNHRLVTPQMRIAYRKAQAELQAAAELARVQWQKPDLTGLSIPAIPDSPWSIDQHGCLTRRVGG